MQAKIEEDQKLCRRLEEEFDKQDQKIKDAKAHEGELRQKNLKLRALRLRFATQVNIDFLLTCLFFLRIIKVCRRLLIIKLLKLVD